MNLEQIIKSAIAYTNKIPAHSKVFDVYEGNLNAHVKNVLATELSPESFKIASKRIPSINLMSKITKKLSQAYKTVPKRSCESDSDQEILDQYVIDLSINKSMSESDTLLNLSRSFAIEPYVASGKIQLRVLKPTEFMVLSNSPTNPTEANIVVKFMGSVEKDDKNLLVLWIYTASDFIRCLSDGTILEESANPYGMLPIIYGKANSFELHPFADSDFYDNTLLIPRILSDLNYAVQFMSHSRVYGIDIDATKVNTSADSMTLFQSREGEGASPQINTINPTVDVNKVLDLCSYTVNSILDAKGIKVSGVGNKLDANNPASGISKAIDEADVQQVVQENRLILQSVEKRLWKLIGAIHNFNVANNSEFNFAKGLDSPFDVSISFPTIKMLPDPQEQRESLKFQLESGLITKRRALTELYPDLSSDEIDNMIEEIKEEPIKKENINE